LQVTRADGFDAERETAAWVELWSSYDLDRVDRIFLPTEDLTYFSSEKEGLIRGLEAVREHHRGFGFVAGGRPAKKTLWLDGVRSYQSGDAAIVAGVWFFGDRAAPKNQRGPVTLVYVRHAGEWRIAHAHFGNTA
jgi:ketosteroid isomerase-like protein